MVTFDVVGKVGGACSNMEELSKGLTHFANPQMLTIQLRKSSTNCGSSAIRAYFIFYLYSDKFTLDAILVARFK